jgi:hypothetical protein
MRIFKKETSMKAQINEKYEQLKKQRRETCQQRGDKEEKRT